MDEDETMDLLARIADDLIDRAGGIDADVGLDIMLWSELNEYIKEYE